LQSDYTAGYETFAYLGAMNMLNCEEGLMGKGALLLRALWI
jgi:hypothetical protein